MKYFLIVLTGIAFTLNVYSQSATDSVKMVINKMFAAMKDGDGKKLQSCFADSVIFQTVVKTNNGVEVKSESIMNFVTQVSKSTLGDLDERIEFETVKTDGPLAIAWTPYSFYYKGKFSHCGVNSFQLVKLKGEWKIQYIIDTRRKE